MKLKGFPGGSAGKEPICQCRRDKRQGFDPWVGKIPWRRKWQPTPVFWPGNKQRSLVGYIVHGVAKSQTRLSTHTHKVKLKGDDPQWQLGFYQKTWPRMCRLVLQGMKSNLTPGMLVRAGLGALCQRQAGARAGRVKAGLRGSGQLSHVNGCPL